jgi:site-specific DNA-cytosine methylase
MKVLVACEYSARVRDAFRQRGHEAWSCDLLECEGDPRWHLQQPVEEVLAAGWDLMIAHPPCTHLAISGARHFYRKQQEQAQALDFVRLLMAAPIDRWCIENPVSVISSAIAPPSQIIQPWEFGHGETKATCLWLKNLPPLRPTNCVSGRENRVWRMPPGPERWKERSRTYQGVADAMADQWGGTQLPAVVDQLRLKMAS